MTNFDLSPDTRRELVDEMLSMAEGTKKSQRAQRAAIQALVAWHESGKEGLEPYAEDVDGVTWKMACAISSDLSRIFHEELPEGVYANQYERQYVRLRRDAIRLANIRQSRKKQDGLGHLRSLLTL